MSRPRVAVIGAGAIGMSAAMSAGELGARVTVLEQAHPAAGSSSLSLGVFNRQTPNLDELALRISSVALLERIAADGALPLERDGYLRLARRPEDVARFERTVAAQRELGYDGARVVDPDELHRIVPDLEVGDLAGALYGADDGTFDGHLVCAAYQARAEAFGARVIGRATVVGADVRADGIVLRTAQGDVACDRVINAAGPWAQKVGRLLGVECPLIVERHRVAMARVDPPLAYRMPVVNEYVPGSGESGLVLRQERSGGLLAMLHAHEALGGDVVDPDTAARAVGLAYVEQVAERLASRLPALVDRLSLDEGWAGLYPISPDGRFLVGPHDAEPRVIAAAGVGGVGITVSGAMGRLAAEWAVLGRADAFPFADALLPDRESLRAP